MNQHVIALSERGLSPYANQDTVFYATHPTVTLLALADGMGGYQAGDVASRMTIETMYDVLQAQLADTSRANDMETLTAAVEAAIWEANTAVYHYAHAHDTVMGSTITCAVVVGNRVIVANVGDSRTYLVRAGRLKQLTVDHSLVEHLVQHGVITEAERYGNANGNVVTRGIGNQPTVAVDLFIEPLQPDDQLFLCSDGLWGAFPDNHIVARQLMRDDEMGEIGLQIVQSAMDAGSSDHISLVWAKLN